MDSNIHENDLMPLQYSRALLKNADDVLKKICGTLDDNIDDEDKLPGELKAFYFNFLENIKNLRYSYAGKERKLRKFERQRDNEGERKLDLSMMNYENKVKDLEKDFDHQWPKFAEHIEKEINEVTAPNMEIEDDQQKEAQPRSKLEKWREFQKEFFQEIKGNLNKYGISKGVFDSIEKFCVFRAKWIKNGDHYLYDKCQDMEGDKSHAHVKKLLRKFKDFICVSVSIDPQSGYSPDSDYSSCKDFCNLKEGKFAFFSDTNEKNSPLPRHTVKLLEWLFAGYFARQSKSGEYGESDFYPIKEVISIFPHGAEMRIGSASLEGEQMELSDEVRAKGENREEIYEPGTDNYNIFLHGMTPKQMGDCFLDKHKRILYNDDGKTIRGLLAAYKRIQGEKKVTRVELVETDDDGLNSEQFAYIRAIIEDQT